MRVFIFLVTLVLSHSIFIKRGDAEVLSYPSSVAVMGDSISEGMLTEYSLERPPTLGQWLGALGKIRDALGVDALSIVRSLFARAYHSWATGDDATDLVFSHYERLKRLNPDIVAHNFAISGSTSQDLDAQSSELLRVESELGAVTDYLIVLIGANDLNVGTKEEMPGPTHYGFNIESSLRRILSQNARRHVLLVSLPKIHEVMDRSKNFAVYNVIGKKIRCDALRRNVYGNRMLFARKGTLAYQASRMMAEMYRNELDRVAATLKADFPALEIRSVRDYDVINLDFKALSVDCFHPSALGQALLAELTWRQGFWADLVSEEDLLEE